MLLKNNLACGSDVTRSWRLNSCSQRRPFPAAVEMELALRRSGCSTSSSGHGERENGGDWLRRFHLLAHLSNHGSHNFAGREPRSSRGASLILVQWHDFLWETTRFQIQVQGALSTEFTVTIEELGITSRTNCSHCLGKLLLSCPRPIIVVRQCL